MTPFLKNMLVIARRDFLAIVATPTFLLFLLAPLFMVGMGLAGGMGASQLADSARGAGRIVAVDPVAQGAQGEFDLAIGKSAVRRRILAHDGSDRSSSIRPLQRGELGEVFGKDQFVT